MPRPLRAEVGERAVTRAFLTLIAGEEGDMVDAMDLVESTWEPSYLSMGARCGAPEPQSGNVRQPDATRREQGWRGARLRPRRMAACDVECARGATPALRRPSRPRSTASSTPRFSAYFDEVGEPSIRLDEIVWGGVRQDGIPPLRNPTMLAADDIGYLEDDHIVFGISVNGDARAYPKRILAWHEMFVDVVGGGAGCGRVLHALRHRDPLSYRARRG